MARLIVKSPYIKCGSGDKSAGRYMNYIATRERVEVLEDGRPPTRKQEQLIAKLTKDFPDATKLPEYGDYAEKPTKANASLFITMALESNWDAVSTSDGYARYIATRPRAERLGSHGLFGDKVHVDLDKALAELQSYQGNVWTHIISLKREDAERLGYDHANAWRILIRTHRNDIAAAMKIPPNDFRWYAAFHDEGDHPHIHMMAWSVKPGQAYLNKDGIREIKSELTNDIFRQEMLHIYEQKSESRDELVRQARREMKKLTQEMRQSLCSCPKVETLMTELAQRLETVKGKKSYGYLPKNLKPLVDSVVDEMELLPAVTECYETWWQLQCQVNDFYSERERRRPPLSQQKEFRQIKNAVIREAENLRLGAVTFEDKDTEQDRIDLSASSSDCWELWLITQDDAAPMGDRDEAAARLINKAEGGDRDARYLVGKLYQDGPVLIPDGVEARYWFDQAARQGHTAAQYEVGKIMLSNDSEVYDPALGIRWLEYAAQNGNNYAAYRLGKEYLQGKVVEKDVSKAVEWLTQSAEAGNPFAQYMLGKLYLESKDIPRDKEMAVYWLTKSAGQGNDYAQHLLDHPDQSPSVLLSVTRLLHHMSRVFQDQTPAPPVSGGMRIDRKRLAQLREKKIAMGHKPDDHEEYQGPSMTM